MAFEIKVKTAKGKDIRFYLQGSSRYKTKEFGVIMSIKNTNTEEEKGSYSCVCNKAVLQCNAATEANPQSEKSERKVRGTRNVTSRY